MRLPKPLLLLCFSFLLLVIASCGPSPTPMVLITPSLPAEATTAFTLTPTTPSRTPTALVVPSATIATIAVVPTLNTDQAYNLLRRLIDGNPNCQLPCWAGIKPGITPDAEAQTLLQPLSTLIYGGPFYPYKGKELSGPGGGRDFFFDDTKIRFDFGWVTERGKDRVEFLGISADALNRNSEWVYGAEPYNQLFEKYNLHNILFQYGIPSQVWTIAEVYNYGNDKPNPNPEEFRLLLFYDQGIFIKYTMPLKREANVDNKGKACPSEAFFDMGLVSPENSQFYQGMWFSSVTGSQDFSSYMPIERATQMTFDEFNQVFKESNSPCFEIPLTIWPKH